MPDGSEVKDQTNRLVFEDVREEGSLSSWRKANWELVDHGVRVVGSRNKEVERREKLVREIYQGNESFVTLRGYRIHWLTLSMGSLDWSDYTVSTTVKTEEQTSSAGIAFRYLNAREYYAFVLDTKNEEAKLVLRKMDREATANHPAWIELRKRTYKLLPDKQYKIQAEVRGEHIICSIDDAVILEFKDAYRRNGKIALIADDPVEFGPVTVNGEMNFTEPTKPVKFDKPELIYDLPLPGTNIRRDFYFLDPDSDGENEIIIAEYDGDKYAYRCLEFNGTELWTIDNMEYSITEGGDYTIQVFDINGDGLNEIITAIDFQIQVREGRTGKLLKSVSTPNQNPYFDSRNYQYPKLLGDAICPVQISPDQPPGFYIKDRYTNIWLYDHNLNQLWHKDISTAHFPLPVDIDGDGIDEILVNHTLLRTDGSVIWKLPLSDHVDNIAYVSLNPGKEPEYFYLASGEMGLLKVNPSSGEIVNRFELGHVQLFAIADLLPEKDGLEMIAQTSWREDQINYLFDKDLNMVSTWQGAYGRSYPVPWGLNGTELAIGPDGMFDPFTGQILDPPLGRVLDVFADNRWGNVLVCTEEENHLKIYSSRNDSKLEPVLFAFSEIQSHYLPVIRTYLNK